MRSLQSPTIVTLLLVLGGSIQCALGLRLNALDSPSSTPRYTSSGAVNVGHYMGVDGTLMTALKSATNANLNATVFSIPAGSYPWKGTWGSKDGFRDNITIEGAGANQTHIWQDLKGMPTGQIHFFRKGVATGNHIRHLRMSLFNVNTSHFSSAIEYEHSIECSVTDSEFDSTYVPGMTMGTIRWGLGIQGSERSTIQRVKTTRAEIIVCGDGRGGQDILVSDIEVNEADDFAVTCVGTTERTHIRNVTFQNILVQNISGCGGFFLGTDGKPKMPTLYMKDVFLKNITIKGQRTNHFVTHQFGEGIKIQAGVTNENIVIKDVKMSLADNPDPQPAGINVAPHSYFQNFTGLHIENVEIGSMGDNERLAILLDVPRISDFTMKNVLIETAGLKLRNTENSVIENTKVADGITFELEVNVKNITVKDSSIQSRRQSSAALSVGSEQEHHAIDVEDFTILNTTFNAPQTPIGVNLYGGNMTLSVVNSTNLGGDKITKETRRAVVYQHGNVGFGNL